MCAKFQSAIACSSEVWASQIKKPADKNVCAQHEYLTLRLIRSLLT